MENILVHFRIPKIEHSKDSMIIITERERVKISFNSYNVFISILKFPQLLIISFLLFSFI